MQIITFQRPPAGTRWGAFSHNRAVDLNAAHANRGLDMFLAPTVLDFLHAGVTTWNAAATRWNGSATNNFTK